MLDKYCSIKEAAELLNSKIEEKIRPRDILELARTGKIRVCVPFYGKIELCIYEPYSFPKLQPVMANKLFNGYIQIPAPSIRLDSKEFGLRYAEIYKSLDAGSNEDKWLKPTEKAPRLAARRIRNFNEKTNEIEYELFHINPIEFEIPEQELLELEKFMQQTQETKIPAEYCKPEATDEDKRDGEEIAELFDPVKVAALEKMFPSVKWESWANHASSNGLKEARIGKAKYNPYKAAMWFLDKGEKDWDLARIYRVLTNNLPPRSLDKKYLLTNDLD